VRTLTFDAWAGRGWSGRDARSVESPQVLWDGQAPLQWASVGVLAVFMFYDAGRSVSYAIQTGRIRDYDSDLLAVLSGGMATVARTTGAPWDEVAMHYYRQRGLLHWRRCRPGSASGSEWPSRWGSSSMSGRWADGR
jgi:hypothetical protein